MPQLKNRMIVEGSDKLKFCGGSGDDGHLTFASSSSRKNTCHSEVKNLDHDNDDVPLSKRLSRMSNLGTRSSNCDVPIKKRPFDNNNLLNNSAKKSECKRKRHEEEKTLESIERDQYSNEIETMIEKMSCVEGIKDSLKEMEGRIGECVKEFMVKEARLFFMDLIRERKQYEEQVNALRLKEEWCTKREMDLESKDKLVESRKKELDLKENQVEIRETTVELKKNQLEIREKEVESKKKQLDEQFMELRSKEKKFKARMQKVKSFVSQIEDFK